MSEKSGSKPAIRKVKSITFSQFRGFKKQDQKVDTNADLVLISGPNGYGKSSFLEGLLLVLTGFWSGRSSSDLISLGASDNKFKISAEVATIQMNKDDHPICFEWPNNNGSQRPEGLPDSRLGDPELEARLCGFFQDQVEHLFDEASQGNTLRDVYDPSTKWIRHLKRFFEELSERLEAKKGEINKNWTGEHEDILNENLKRAWTDFLVPYRAAALRMDLVSAPDSGDEEAVTDFANQTFNSMGMPFSRDKKTELIKTMADLIQDKFKRTISEAKLKSSEDVERAEFIKQKIEKTNQEINKIKTSYPNLKADLASFKAKNPQDPDMETIFRALSRNASEWSRIQITQASSKGGVSGKPLKRVFEEFEAVLPEEAGKCLSAVKTFLGPLKKAEMELDRLESEKNKLEAELTRARISDEVIELLDLRNRLNKTALAPLTKAWEEKQAYNLWKSMQPHREAACAFLVGIDCFRKEFEAFANTQDLLSRKMLGHLTKTANQVMRRFSLVKGFLPLALKKDDDRDHAAYLIQTRDKRKLTHFSTGQRTQAAVALLTAQNLMVSHMLTHRIIMLDDVTTSYDLSNLTREALLWRQLAYGMEDSQDDNRSRQIFISSHHEDLTNHLLDLLVPPKGRSMRLLKFEAWTPTDGPVIKAYDVTPTRSAKKEVVRKEFAESLKEVKW